MIKYQQLLHNAESKISFKDRSLVSIYQHHYDNKIISFNAYALLNISIAYRTLYPINNYNRDVHHYMRVMQDVVTGIGVEKEMKMNTGG